MPGAERIDARLCELIAPPPDVVGSWGDQWPVRLAAHAAGPGCWIPWRWPCGVSRGKGHRLLRDRPWTYAFQADLEGMLAVEVHEREEIANLLLPQRLLDWASASPTERAWALRLDIADKRLYWCFAFYQGRLQHAFGRRWLEPASRRAYHDLLWRRADQGGISHLSEHLFAAVLPLYDRLGIQRIELTAGLARGGALWPAFGAVPRDDHVWHRLGKEIHSRLRREPDQVQAEVRERIEGHLSAGPHAILDIVNEASGSDSAPPRLGQRLLAGTRYEAVIELGNPETRKILENRIGKIYSPK